MEEKKSIWSNLEEYLLVAIIALITLLVLVSFVLQFAAPDQVAGMNQLSFYAYTWLVFLGVAVAIKNNSHMRIDIIYAQYPESVKKAISLFIEVLMGIFCVVLAFLSVIRAIQVVRSGELNAAIAIPVSVLYLAPAVGFVLSVVRYVERLIKKK